jgi:hypothetical protein
MNDSSTCRRCGQEIDVIPMARHPHVWLTYDPGQGERHIFTCTANRYSQPISVMESDWPQIEEQMIRLKVIEQPKPKGRVHGKKLPT